MRNPGGTPAQVSITAAPAEEGVAVDVEPSTLAIVPGGSALARVRVRPRGSQWFGRRVHRFQVTVAPNLVLDGAMAQRARVPIVVILLVAAALAGLGASRDARRVERRRTDHGDRADHGVEGPTPARPRPRPSATATRS